MKLVGLLKKKVEEAETKEEVREVIKNAGVLLDDDELEKVSGGKGPTIKERVKHDCPYCGFEELVGYGGRWTLKGSRSLPTYYCYKAKKWYSDASNGVFYNYEGYRIKSKLPPITAN